MHILYNSHSTLLYMTLRKIPIYLWLTESHAQLDRAELRITYSSYVWHFLQKKFTIFQMNPQITPKQLLK